MSDLIFRPAQRDDLPELHALIEGAYRGESARAGWTHEADLIEGPRTSQDALAASLDNPDDLLLLAVDGARIVGCVQLTRHAPSIAYISLLTVNPQRQATGLGQRILAEAERAAVNHFGATTAELSVVSQRSALIDYYQRRGYRLTGERRAFPIPFDPPFTLVVLDKPLQDVTA
ncbi:GNAT family N-acetyltransferase [Sphingomonas sp. ASY06-1R]|uniref:GNAT family N-acetyltransferase n=1 Tax=Sphingomonas sp. ASY06-1R TaxID=3445771 RepID=UPI003FA2068E